MTFSSALTTFGRSRWSSSLGVAASDQRYTQAGRGKPGTGLRKAWEDREAARKSYEEGKR